MESKFKKKERMSVIMEWWYRAYAQWHGVGRKGKKHMLGVTAQKNVCKHRRHMSREHREKESE